MCARLPYACVRHARKYRVAAPSREPQARTGSGYDASHAGSSGGERRARERVLLHAPWIGTLASSTFSTCKGGSGREVGDNMIDTYVR